MSKILFKKINDTFIFKDKLEKEILEKCSAFLKNQIGIEKELVQKVYNDKLPEIIELPKKINIKDVDIIIKTKYNNDFKFVNFNKSEIFYKCEKNRGIDIGDINKYKLNKINFFPQTTFNNDFIFQKLAKGVYYRPNKLSEFNEELLKNVSYIIEVLSSICIQKTDFNNYINSLSLSFETDKLNFKIINRHFLHIEKHLKKLILKSLTHGDLKFEHIFTLNGKLEYIVDWENVGIRSTFFDLFNFFIPWFIKRSYSYNDIKNYILRFVKNYLPQFKEVLIYEYDLYFSVFVLERYARIHSGRSSEFDLNSARKRYYSLFKDL